MKKGYRFNEGDNILVTFCYGISGRIDTRTYKVNNLYIDVYGDIIITVEGLTTFEELYNRNGKWEMLGKRFKILKLRKA